jgi:Zn-dependent peptidase ImmA (M78 family)/DNA-binding XRE family transcriptional regulator
MNPLDMLDPATLGERLRVARSRAGMTQDVAAKRLKIARTTVVAIEQGQRRVRSEELMSMAHLYGTSINELGRASAVQVDLLPRFRALSNAPHDPAVAAAKLLNDLAAAECELEQLLNRPLRRHYPPERQIFAGDIREQAEEAALELRHRLGLGLAPISDIVSLLELEIGVRVFVRPLGHSALSGLFAFDESIGACILLNANHPRERRAMTAGHEMGHLVASRKQPEVLYLDRSPQSREEKFAAAFGTALLLPAAAVRSRFAEIVQDAGRFSPRHLVILAHANNVSYEAMCRRMEELSLLPGGTWDSLKDRGFSGRLATQVLGDADFDLQQQIIPPRLWLLVSEAHDRGLLSEGQLATLLRVDRVEIRRMLDLVTIEDHDVPQTIASR